MNRDAYREFRRLVEMARARYSLPDSFFGTVDIERAPGQRALGCLNRTED